VKPPAPDVAYQCGRSRRDRVVIHPPARPSTLLTNALKFTPSGGRVTVQAGPAGPKAALRVTDTGVGIPADELPKIFDRLWRGRGAAHVSGSGIGLAVAAELARAHGGQLGAISEPGHGAQITLTLPRAWGRPAYVRTARALTSFIPSPPQQHRPRTTAGLP